MKLLTAEQWDRLWEMSVGEAKELAKSIILALISDYYLSYHEGNKEIISSPDYCDIQDLLGTFFCQDFVGGKPKNIKEISGSLHFSNSRQLYFNYTKENWPLRLIKKTPDIKTTTHYYRDRDGKLFKKDILGIMNIWGVTYNHCSCIMNDLLITMVPSDAVMNNKKYLITEKEWNKAMKKVKEGVNL